MNCKPGDLAICIRDIQTALDWHFVECQTAGRIVRVLRLEQPHDDGKAMGWLLEQPLQVDFAQLCCSRRRGVVFVTHIDDKWLRPLPPLSDGERDKAEAGKPEQVAA